MANDFKSGFAVLVGRPNTGKSTLLNALAEQKVAIISDKPQTTRNAIRAVVNKPDGQIIFVDTPGFHKPKHALGEHLNQKVLSTLKEVDVILFVLDAAAGIGGGDRYFSEYLKRVKTEKLVVVNKIDAVPAGRLEGERELAERLAEEIGARKVVEISALKKKNIGALLSEVLSVLPEGPKYYPDGMITDQPETAVASEIIREKILLLTEEEIPHSVLVDVDRVEKRPGKDITDIDAVIYVEKESQKGILIGKEGWTVKKVGSLARRELEALFGNKVFLGLRVKVRKKWRKDEAFIKRMEG